jgi:hypothetical protein
MLEKNSSLMISQNLIQKYQYALIIKVSKFLRGKKKTMCKHKRTKNISILKKKTHTQTHTK